MLSRFAVIASSAALFALVACSSSSTGSSSGGACNSNPWSCPSGQTCWPTNSTGNFECLNSKQGVQKGAACQNYPGSPTCGDGMFCFQQTTTGGTCTTYCDSSNPAHGCAAGETCTPITVGATTTPQAYVCLPNGSTQDAGAQNDAGTASDAASGDATTD